MSAGGPGRPEGQGGGGGRIDGAAHLGRHQRVILGRAITAGLASLLPVPWLDEVLAESVRTQLIRTLAEAHRVDVDATAAATLSHPSDGRVLRAAGVGVLALGSTRRVMRRVAASLFVLRRLDETVETFLIGTLFDHYCARHHVGGAVDAAHAARLRAAFDRSLEEARSEALRALFRELLAEAGQRLRSLPQAARQLVGALRREAGSASRSQAPVDAEQLSDGPLGELFARELDAAELRLLDGGYLPILLSRFDLAWAAVLAQGPTLPERTPGSEAIDVTSPPSTPKPTP